MQVVDQCPKIEAIHVFLSCGESRVSPENNIIDVQEVLNTLCLREFQSIGEVITISRDSLDRTTGTSSPFCQENREKSREIVIASPIDWNSLKHRVLRTS
jgi:hypothetical protein